MMFTRGEVETLGLCALCKDFPAEAGTLREQKMMETFERVGLIRKSRSGLSYRVSNYGYDYLQNLGLIFTRDKTYLGKSKALYRRLEAAKTASFFLKCGADVSVNINVGINCDNIFVPSFLYRRQSSSNLLGITRMLGFYYLRNVMFIPYYISEDNNGIYADVEEKTFTSEIVSRKRTPIVLFTSNGDLHSVIKCGLKKVVKKEKLHSQSFFEAIKKFRTPVAFITFDSNGLDAISIMSVKDYRTKLARLILMNDYEKPTLKFSDGINAKTKENFIIGIDSNIVAMKEVIKNSDKTTHILLLPYQQSAIQKLLRGSNARLHTVEADELMKMLGIDKTNFGLSNEPYITKGGGYAYVPIVGQNEKVRGQKRTNLQKS